MFTTLVICIIRSNLLHNAYTVANIDSDIWETCNFMVDGHMMINEFIEVQCLFPAQKAKFLKTSCKCLISF